MRYGVTLGQGERLPTPHDPSCGVGDRVRELALKSHRSSYAELATSSIDKAVNPACSGLVGAILCGRVRGGGGRTSSYRSSYALRVEFDLSSSESVQFVRGRGGGADGAAREWGGGFGLARAWRVSGVRVL